MKELIQEKIDLFNEKAQTDEKLQRELEGITRTVQIEVEDGPNYKFIIDNKQISGFGEGDIDSPDVRLISDTETLTGVLKGEIGPMKAYVTKKLKLKASIEDLLRLRKFLK